MSLTGSPIVNRGPQAVAGQLFIPLGGGQVKCAEMCHAKIQPRHVINHHPTLSNKTQLKIFHSWQFLFCMFLAQENMLPGMVGKEFECMK